VTTYGLTLLKMVRVGLAVWPSTGMITFERN